MFNSYSGGDLVQIVAPIGYHVVQSGNFPQLHRANSCSIFNPLNAGLNPICHLPALLGAYRILHVSRIMVNLLKTKRNPLYIRN
jgi:hypothetical protein